MQKDDVLRLAALARITVSDVEAEALKDELASVLDYVSVVDDITAEAGITKKVGAVYNVFRADEATNEPGAETETLLAEVPAREGNYLKVKKILTTD